MLGVILGELSLDNPSLELDKEWRVVCLCNGGDKCCGSLLEERALSIERAEFDKKD